MKRFAAAAVLLLLLGGVSRAQVLRHDLGQLSARRNLGYVAVGLGLAGVVHPWDDDLKGSLKGFALLERPSDITDVLGASSFNLPASAAVWGLGRMAQRPELEQLGSALVRTLVLTQAVVAPIKVGVGRQRPDRSNRLSFPSGHTANSFAMARLLHRCYGRRIGIPLYALSAVVAAGRIEGDRHYLSDVVMGAILGLVVGNSVTPEPDARLGVGPQITTDGVVLAVRISP